MLTSKQKWKFSLGNKTLNEDSGGSILDSPMEFLCCLKKADPKNNF